MLVLVLIYALYLVYVVCRAFGSMVSGGSSPLLGSRLTFFNLFTLVIFLLTIAGFMAGFLTPLVKSNGTYRNVSCGSPGSGGILGFPFPLQSLRFYVGIRVSP